MRQNNQDALAGRIQPSQFDTILPPDARAEMLKPQRPAILRRPPGLSHSLILKWIGAFALTVIILAGTIGNYSQSRKVLATPQPK
jgi:hypothetical protein